MRRRGREPSWWSYRWSNLARTIMRRTVWEAVCPAVALDRRAYDVAPFGSAHFHLSPEKPHLPPMRTGSSVTPWTSSPHRCFRSAKLTSTADSEFISNFDQRVISALMILVNATTHHSSRFLVPPQPAPHHRQPLPPIYANKSRRPGLKDVSLIDHSIPRLNSMHLALN